MSDKTGTERKYQAKPGGQFIEGNPGRPLGSKSFTTKVKEALLKIAEGKDFTYEEALVKKIMHKAIVEGDPQMIKLMWNYIDGMPAQSMDLTSGGKELPTPIMSGIIKSNVPTNNGNE